MLPETPAAPLATLHKLQVTLIDGSHKVFLLTRPESAATGYLSHAFPQAAHPAQVNAVEKAFRT